MKKLYSTLVLLISVYSAFSNPVITAVTNGGAWNNPATWDLHRVPVNGDTVVIPNRKTVLINDNLSLGGSNLYVKVGGVMQLSPGTLTLGNASAIQVLSGGTIVSDGEATEQIIIGGVVKYSGLEGTIVGAAVANNTTGTTPNGFKGSAGGTLPVKFLTFNIAREHNNVMIQWSTASEINSREFEVQRSSNGSTWTTIAVVDAAGTTTTTQQYSYTDNGVNLSVVYYRIRQVDISGSATLSVVRSLNMNNASLDVRIASGQDKNLYIHFSDQVKSTVAVKLVNLNGQVIYQTQLNKPVGEQVVALSGRLQGVYTVVVSDNASIRTAAQVLL